eukprot:TRINITY_DN31263_c0_g1_i2.p1 TRINITY_DN31263_c0_g1~~TRINITY_DN31263_c0_g1_i2.p1  ORF type:complete len:205 (+),score=46.93 TRINITY_DN31263_c0_g1_i2:45-659(+)
MASSDPKPQVYGQGSGSDPAAELQRQMAVQAAQQGARAAGTQARHGFYEVKAYILENPGSIKVLCFLIGLVLIVFSILGCFNLFGAAFSPKEYLSNIYNVIFGIIICICDGKESWMEKCGNVQAKLFQSCYFLATATGRALFYFYVGSMTLLVLPDSDFWKIFYVAIGGLLVLAALFMLAVAWCGRLCGCKDRYGAMQNDGGRT